MCLQYIKIKNTNKCGLNYAYVPCGKCADCRKKEYNAWRFRLRTEFTSLKKQGWNLGFITLTYRDEDLPKIPKKCFVNQDDYQEITCFDKQEVRHWIQSIRHYCKYHYKMVNGDNIRYFITSEYGSLTHRPHYHAILAWKNGLGLNYETMHKLCKEFWTKGLVGPQHYLGDKNCKSFEIQGDETSALTYVCKYVSKDIDYVDKVKGIDFYENIKKYEEGTKERQNARLYSNCTPFHLQSISLGLESIKSMSDTDKLNLIKNGACFIGDDKTYEVPMYIKNKIIYSNYYVTDENGKRLVRRKATEFFEQNREEFFNKKAEFYNKYLNQVDRKYLEEAGVDNEIIEKTCFALNYYKTHIDENVKSFDLKDMGKLYLAYNNINPDRCFNIPLVEQWMLRYRIPENVEEDYEVEQWELVNNNELSWLKHWWNLIDCTYFYINAVKVADREAKDKLNKKILDFYNNIV